MRRIFIIIVALALSIALSAQEPNAHADANPDAQSEIKALESRLAELTVRANWDEYAKYLGTDYLHTRDNGHVENRDEALASLRDVKRQIIVMEMEPDLAIRIYRDTAVSSAEFTVRVRENGQVKSRRSRETDVFVKRDGQWFLVAGQETTVGK
jgi:uncharacterized protein YchJ